MPTAPSRMCAVPGCGVLVASEERSSYCGVHRVEAERARQRVLDVKRGDATQRGYNARWKRYRVVFLARNPLCVNPHGLHAEGEVVPAVVVDHIVPHRGDTTLFWDRRNHQALCTRCHNVKTAREDSTFAPARTALPPPSGVVGVS